MGSSICSGGSLEGGNYAFEFDLLKTMVHVCVIRWANFVPQCAAIKKRNAALMQTLQLPEAVENVHKVMRVAKKNAQRARKEAQQTSRPAPVRKVYSLRSNTVLPMADSNNCKDESGEHETEAEDEEPEVDWNAVEDSNIHKYLTRNSTDHVRCV